jgi:hypothetical protein
MIGPFQLNRHFPAKKLIHSYKVSDGGGLHLLVTQNGSKLRRLKCRVTGKEKLLSIGEYPAVSLKAARSACDLAKEQLASGDDPSDLKREARLKVVAFENETFKAVADEYIAKLTREGGAPVTLKKRLKRPVDCAQTSERYSGTQLRLRVQKLTRIMHYRRIDPAGCAVTCGDHRQEGSWWFVLHGLTRFVVVQGRRRLSGNVLPRNRIRDKRSRLTAAAP